MVIDFLIIGVILLVIDIVFLTIFLGPKFSIMVKNIQGSPMKINKFGALLSYLALIIGIYHFGLKKVDDNNVLSSALLGGGLFGLLTYAIFDFTNLAIFSKYQWTNALLDVIWGGILCFTVTLLSYNTKSYLIY